MDAFGIHRELVADYRRTPRNDMSSWADDSGVERTRFHPARREMVRAELDAAFFHPYGIVRDDVNCIMETFPIVKRKDETAHGQYRTKRLNLENYDETQRCIDTGTEFVSRLGPAPGFGPRHPERNTDG